MEDIRNDSKGGREIYIDAAWHDSILVKSLKYVFLLMPLILLFMLYAYWRTTDYEITLPLIFLVIILSLVMIGIMIGLKVLQQYQPVEISLDSHGLLFRYPIGKSFVLWNEIQNIKRTEDTMVLIDIAQLATRKGDYYIKATMKNKNNKNLKLIKGFSGKPKEWVDDEGNEVPLILENCELYNEIKRRL